MSAVDWSSLPPELLEVIGTRIKIYSDYVRFRAVCHPWRASSPATPTHLPCQLPWLLSLAAPSQDGGDENDGSRCAFIEMATNKRRHLRLPESLRYRGSSHGWIVSLEYSPSAATVALNPLTGARFLLPPFYTADESSRDKFIRKIILSDSPSRRPDDFTALAVVSGQLVFWKSGEDDWSVVLAAGHDVHEAAYFQGRVYAVDLTGTAVTIYDFSCTTPEIVAKVAVEMPDWSPDRRPDTAYLVPVGDDLYFVVSITLDSKTRSFHTRKLSSCGKKWEKNDDIWNFALFLGNDGCSTAITASDFPGCKPNSIYLTNRSSQQSDNMRSSIWFTPNPY